MLVSLTLGINEPPKLQKIINYFNKRFFYNTNSQCHTNNSSFTSTHKATTLLNGKPNCKNIFSFNKSSRTSQLINKYRKEKLLNYPLCPKNSSNT